MNKKSIILSFIFIISFPLCARYKSAPLKKSYQKINIATQESLYFNYKIFNAHDCKTYFNSKSILKKGYQPIHITFTNNSQKHIAISPASFNFRCADALDVANNLHRDGMARGLGFGLGSLWFFPLIFPALIQGCGAHNYNEQMDLDFSHKALKNQVVAPYTTIDGIIFACGYESNKDFTLIVEDIHQKHCFILSSTKLLHFL